MFHAFYRELRRTFRVITKTPVLSIIAVLSLALGVAANATIWSVVHAFLLRPLPYPEADRIVMLWQNPTAQAQDDQAVAPANYFDWKESAESFSMLGAADFGSVNLTGIDQPEQLSISHMTPELLADLEPVPLEGRLFLPDEGGEGNRPVLLSATLWRQRFQESPDIVGREITLDGALHTVVGVLPDSFDHLLGTVELWMAHDFRDQRDERESTELLVTGRLAPGVSHAQAQDEMGALAARLAERYPDTNEGLGVRLETLREMFPGPTDTVLVQILQAVVLLVLLVACVNVASLLLAKADSRSKEMAVRSALGAGRGRLVRQLLVESLLLAVLAGIVGVGLTVYGVRMVAAAMPDEMPLIFWPRFDTPVLVFAIGLSLVAGLVFGIGPALQAIRSRGLRDALVEGGRGGTSGRERKRLLSSFVVAELALALTILIGAAALTDLFHSRLALDPGFEPEGLLTLEVNLPEHRFGEDPAITAFVEEMEREVGSMPGALGVGFTNVLPRARFLPSDDVEIDGRPAEKGLEQRARRVSATPEYFDALKMELRAGRWLRSSDREETAPVALVNERFVETLLAARSPADADGGEGSAAAAPVHDPTEALGRRITVGDAEAEIVGVMRNIAQERMAGLMPHEPTVYFPMAQRPVRDLHLVVKAAADPLALSGAVREAIWALDPEQPVRHPRTLEQHMATQLAGPAMISRILFGVGLLALALAAIGVYGVMAFHVAQQTGEIGIRIALGARPGQILGRVTHQGLVLTVAGLLLGIPGGAIVVRMIGTLFVAAQSDGLTNVAGTDWQPLAAVALLLTTVGLAACLLPARRATRVDPVAALQAE